MSTLEKKKNEYIYNDIANFNDFADEMTEMELKQKMVEHFLRDIYIPSSP
jgi:hypothetical protein